MLNNIKLYSEIRNVSHATLANGIATQDYGWIMKPTCGLQHGEGPCTSCRSWSASSPTTTRCMTHACGSTRRGRWKSPRLRGRARSSPERGPPMLVVILSRRARRSHARRTMTSGLPCTTSLAKSCPGSCRIVTKGVAIVITRATKRLKLVKHCWAIE